MASFLLKHLASSLTRQLNQMPWLTVKTSSTHPSLYRSLASLGAATSRLLTLPVGISPLHPTSTGFTGPATLLGQCQQLACFQPCAGMKTKTALKRRCKDCFIVRRRGRLFVFCKTNPRHKQRQG